MKFVAAIAGLAFCACAQAAVPTLEGDTIDAYMFRTVAGMNQVGRINGYGLDAPFVVQNGMADAHKYSVMYQLNVDGGKFELDFLNTFQLGNGIVLRLTDLDFTFGAKLQSLSVDSNLTGYTVKVGEDYIELGLGGVKGNANSYFTGTFNVSAVPEPSTYGMLGLGLAVIGLASRRRNAKA